MNYDCLLIKFHKSDKIPILFEINLVLQLPILFY